MSDALPQKNWATQAMPTRTFVPSSPMASMRIGIGAVIRKPAAVTVSKPGRIAKVRASNSTYPAMPDSQTDVTIPFGPATAAFWVSSVMWADASNPVIVYWANRSPMKNT